MGTASSRPKNKDSKEDIAKPVFRSKALEPWCKEVLVGSKNAAELSMLALQYKAGNQKIDDEGNTVLHKMVMLYDGKNPELFVRRLNMLIEGGASPEGKNNEGDTAYDLATEKRCAAQVLELLQPDKEVARRR